MKKYLHIINYILVLGIFSCHVCHAGVSLRVDLGLADDPGTFRSGWTQWAMPTDCPPYAGEISLLNIAGRHVDAHLASADGTARHGLHVREGDAIANTAFFCCESAYPGQEAAGIELRLGGAGLTAGDYTLLSYHSWCGIATMPSVRVHGTGVTELHGEYDVPVLNTTNDAELAPSRVNFRTDGTGDVIVVYQAAEGSTACLNTFILIGLGEPVPMVQFDRCFSSALEAEGPVSIGFYLNDLAETTGSSVDCRITGGTAAGCGRDYLEPMGGCTALDLTGLTENWLLPAGPANPFDLCTDAIIDLCDLSVMASQWHRTQTTVEFAPGQTYSTIQLQVIDDGLDEDDETVLLSLANPVGPGLTIGPVNYRRHTITDPRPVIAFSTPSTRTGEANVNITATAVLSRTMDEAVNVDYAVDTATASGGTDYRLSAETLTFEPGQTAKNITLEVFDDMIEEENETITLSLSNPSAGVRLNACAQHTVTIIDDDSGVYWDGKLWHYSSHTREIFINGDGDLEWSPEKGEQFITRIGQRRLSEPGDSVEISYIWMTDGDHGCPDCFSCELYCLDDDITCIAGTSDIRVGLFEADGQYVEVDGLGISNDIFRGYKGYNFRFGPNMLSGPNRWVDCTGEVHKTGNFGKKPPDSDSLMVANEGLMDYIDGFELAPGQYSTFTVRLERLSHSSIRMSITLNGRTYTDTDSSGDDQPQKIDVLAVYMRNGRPYSRLVLRQKY